MKIISFIILLLIYSLTSHACRFVDNESPQILVFPPKFDSKDPEHDYVFQLLQLILKKSNEKFGECKAHLFNHRITLKRMELYLEKNEFIDVVALTVSNTRDNIFLPIPIPISKGLMGYRLFMIRDGDSNIFSKINSLTDLRNLTAGQGIGWADVRILEHNKLPVITGGSIKSLIDMLTFNRFDYFPRGTLQVMIELENYEKKQVQLEKHLVLTYPSMTAFYVSKGNKNLAKRLEYGLKKAFYDGSFELFFNSHPSSIKALELLNLKNRLVLKICNPMLPEWVPINEKEYWLEPWPKGFQKEICFPEK